MIRSFRCAETEKIFLGRRTIKFAAIEKTALRKLMQLQRAGSLRDLRSPGNSLEALSKERAGQHSIRINEKYRLCFVWKDVDTFQVEIVDYH